MDPNSQIMVSVLCIVYNHEKFLRRCLEGLVCQQTDFQYEIIVHDDCSTDASKEIIKEFAEKYSTITAIYEKENQWRQRKGIICNIVFPLARGKYIAICEGDDYWTDNTKLQKQFDYMESHNECSLCVHNTVINDLLGRNKKRLFNNWKTIHQLTAVEVITAWKVHMTSFFFRYDALNYRKELPGVWKGDYAMLLYAFSKGTVVALPDIMSVYNFNNRNGEINRMNTVSNDSKNRLTGSLEFLYSYNKYTKYKYDKLITAACCPIMRDIIAFEMILNMGKKITFKSFRKESAKAKRGDLFREYWSKAKGREKIKGFAVFNFYGVFRYYMYRRGFVI